MQNDRDYILESYKIQNRNLSNEVVHLRGQLEVCVSKEDYQALETECDALTAEVGVLEESKKTYEHRIEDLEKDNEAKAKEAREWKEKYDAANAELEKCKEAKEASAELADMLKQKNCDAKSIVELLTRCIFGRSSEQSEIVGMMANAAVTAMNVQDADEFVGQLVQFKNSAMACAGKKDLVNDKKDASVPKPKAPSAKKNTTSRNKGNSRKGEKRMKNGFETVGSVLDEKFGISYERYGKDVTYTIKKRKGKDDSWTIAIAYISKPSVYVKEYTVANIYAKGLGDDTSDRPAQIVEGCPYSPSFASLYLTLKFRYNLSELKIINMLKEMGCKVKQSTLNKWMHRVMSKVREALEPWMLKEVHSSKFMHNDETRITVRVWDEKKQKEEYRTCYIHGAYAPDKKIMVMVYENGSRAATVAEEAIFKDFTGEGFTADRCPIYPLIVEGHTNVYIEYGACWTHGRRYNLQAFLSDHRFEGVMKCINVLFSIEKHCRIMNMTPQKRLEFRKEHSAPIVDSIMEFLKGVRDSKDYGELAKRAANYMLNDEHAFRAFLRNGYIEIENNAIERLFRHLATGRRNWNHSGSHAGAKNIAFMYSLVETCRLNDVNFDSYIEEVLNRIQSGDTNYRDMLPSRIVLPAVAKVA